MNTRMTRPRESTRPASILPSLGILGHDWMRRLIRVSSAPEEMRYRRSSGAVRGRWRRSTGGHLSWRRNRHKQRTTRRSRKQVAIAQDMPEAVSSHSVLAPPDLPSHNQRSLSCAPRHVLRPGTDGECLRLGLDREQTLNLQFDAQEDAGCDTIYQEIASGAKADLFILEADLSYLWKGDTLVVW